MNQIAANINKVEPVGFSCCRMSFRPRAPLATLFLLSISLCLPVFAWAGTPTESKTPSTGFLKVFSSTESAQWGEGGYYYVHTGYRIYNATGKLVKWIENRDGSINGDPENVELPSGKYLVWAQSDTAGYVKIPVLIKAAQTTGIHLEADETDTKGNSHESSAVATTEDQTAPGQD